MKQKLLSLVLMLPAIALGSDAFKVHVTGHGKPMILIPGLASSGETWDSTVARYRDRYECHVLTVAGFAGIPRIPAPILDTVREQLAAYIREKQLVKPVIVGHSLGGFIALDLASKYPELPGKLVIVDSYPSLAAIFQPEITTEQIKAQAAMTRQYMASQPADPKGSDAAVRAMVTKDSDYERIASWSHASDRSAVVDAMAELYGSDLRENVSAIQSPTLVLATWIGYKDFTVREKVEASVKRQYEKLKGAGVRMSDTARHFIMYDDPQWFFAQIDGFLMPDHKGELR
jgi:pimeloyl-ACP methyl ester carboxylesterase